MHDEKRHDSYLGWKLDHISRIFCLFVCLLWVVPWMKLPTFCSIHPLFFLYIVKLYFSYMISWVRPRFFCGFFSLFAFVFVFCFLFFFKGRGWVRIAHLLSFLWCVFCFVSVGYILFCLYSFYVLCPMSLVSLDHPFVIAPSVVPNVYSQIMLHFIIVKCYKNLLIFK